MFRRWRAFGLLLILSSLIGLLVFGVYAEIKVRMEPPALLVAFLDVGQGDAAFIESPSRTQVLIDGGRDSTILRELSAVLGYFDRTIDVVVATHPDADHIGGLVDVLKRYRVHTIVMTTNQNDTPAYEAFMHEVRKEGATVIIATRGQTLDLGSGMSGSTTLNILFPDRDVTHLESNTSSIVLKLTYGMTDFLFTGDSPEAIEKYLIELDGTRLRSEVLKLGHHGSRTSSHPLFIETVMPQLGIISAGKENTYGHPHEEVLATMSAASITTKNTADEGSIFVLSDGNSIRLTNP